MNKELIKRAETAIQLNNIQKSNHHYHITLIADLVKALKESESRNHS